MKTPDLQVGSTYEHPNGVGRARIVGIDPYSATPWTIEIDGARSHVAATFFAGWRRVLPDALADYAERFGYVMREAEDAAPGDASAVQR